MDTLDIYELSDNDPQPRIIITADDLVNLYEDGIIDGLKGHPDAHKTVKGEIA